MALASSSSRGLEMTSTMAAVGVIAACTTAGHSFISATSASSAGAGRGGEAHRRFLGARSHMEEPRGPEAAALCLGTGLFMGTAMAMAASRPTGARSQGKKPMAGVALSVAQRRSRTACRAMFERFSSGSMKSVMMAQAESRKLGHDRVGTEMLVVGILAEGNDRGFRVLHSAGVTLEQARIELEELVGRGPGGKAIEIPFTQGSKQVLEEAIELASKEDSSTVGSDHLLRAILMQEDGLGMKLLGLLLDCGSPVAIREKVYSQLKEEAAPENSHAGDSFKNVPLASDAGSRNMSPAGQELQLTETLKYSEDLTQAAEEGRLDPLVGREAQLERSIRILGRRSKNNPVYVGEAGVGKTSIACGLAQRIVQGRVPPTLKGKRVLSLDLALLLAGTRYRGDFEERLRAVVQEVTNSNRQVILVIDEVHTLVGAGSSGGEGGGMDAANLLKPALARGQLQCIGATTLDEYRQYIEKDPALERRFQPVFVPEPTEEEAAQILKGLAPRYEKHHGLRYTPEAIKAAVKLASQYVTDRFLPDKAIDVMDEAGAKVRQQLFEEQERDEELKERREMEAELEAVRRSKQRAVASEDYEEAQRLKSLEVEIQARMAGLSEEGGRQQPKAADLDEKLKVLRARVQEAVAAERFAEASELKAKEREVLGTSSDRDKEAWVTEADVAQVVASWTGVAVEQVSATESARLMTLEQQLSESVVGQQEAVNSVSRALRRARAGLRSQSRPIAALMFSGPTGVGKTELCRTLASSFFGSSDSMIRLDMSEFMEKHTVSKLIGAPPGYVGFGEGGTLTEAVRRRPYSLVLFDEVEKAHPDVFNLLLQLLDDGRLTDSKGRHVSFSNTMIILTSNIGSRSVQKGVGGGGGLGFGVEEDSQERNYNVIRELVHEEMKSFFRPEFLNRLDEICVFRPLTKEDIRAIAEVEIRKVLARLGDVGMNVSLTARFKDHVANVGFDPEYGARPLRRAITRLLEDTLAEYILTGMSTPPANSEQDLQLGMNGASSVKRALIDILEDGKIQVHTLPSRIRQLEAA
eukprot:TRINITY_DN14713_c0_g2_i1.p1 TRINITY_DN14713_c0_g2~~TRINITY_DN14713_c0_g2_i1.p1  ORF type:complete len:1038 (+),score=237.12 TRINITY_DN14713_c0_g2_i1:40-3153(+)